MYVVLSGNVRIIKIIKFSKASISDYNLDSLNLSIPEVVAPKQELSPLKK